MARAQLDLRQLGETVAGGALLYGFRGDFAASLARAEEVGQIGVSRGDKQLQNWGHNLTVQALVRLGRAKAITGPYLDREGNQMLHGGGTPLLSANDRWLGPGGESLLIQKHGPDLIVYHAYDHTTGKPSLQLSTIAWEDGWPTAALSTTP